MSNFTHCRHCFLKYACPISHPTPHRLLKSKGCPLLLPLFSSSLLPPFTATIWGWPSFQVWQILQCWIRLLSNRLTATEAYQRAATDASAVLNIVPTHPFCRNEPIILPSGAKPRFGLCLYSFRHISPAAPLQSYTGFAFKSEGLPSTPSSAIDHTLHSSKPMARSRPGEFIMSKTVETTLWRAIMEEESAGQFLHHDSIYLPRVCLEKIKRIV